MCLRLAFSVECQTESVSVGDTKKLQLGPEGEANYEIPSAHGAYLGVGAFLGHVLKYC